jgi:large subunit ribosomal protein L18
MAHKLALKSRKYARRKKRVRGKISGTPECPRLSVQKSLKHVYAQIVDDLNGSTLAFVSTLTKDAIGRFESGDKKGQKGFKVGQLIAELASSKGIEKVVFDRQGNRYHGRIKALAEGARKGGLKF